MGAPMWGWGEGASPPPPNFQKTVQSYWLVGKKLLLLSAILLLNFTFLQEFDPILPKLDKIDKVK